VDAMILDRGVAVAVLMLGLGCGGGAAPSGTAGSGTTAAEAQASDSPDEVIGPEDSVQRIALDLDGDGQIALSDLQLALDRWTAGQGTETEVNDVLAVLYWDEQVPQDQLLSALEAHGYGNQWPDLSIGLTRRSSSYTTPGDGGSEDKPDKPAHDTRNSGLHQQYFSTQYDPIRGHTPYYSRNHDLYISQSWGHKESLSRINHHEEDRSAKHDLFWSALYDGHYSSVSNTWPSNHDGRLSRTYPDNHNENLSRSWPPDHHLDNSKPWDTPNHTTGVSRGWPPNHDIQRSQDGVDDHLVWMSRQMPQPHDASLSRSHSVAISNSWPNYPEAHNLVASHTRPPNHFDQVSRSWPIDHKAAVSARWPPNHYDAVSRQWDQNDPGTHNPVWSKYFPPNHTYFESVKGTVGIIKDLKKALPTKSGD
jgi:hypothetical protein